MTIELRNFNEDDRLPAAEAAHVGAQIAVRQGISEGVAFTTGVRCATYAAELVFTALRRMDMFPLEGVDINEFQAAVNAIADESLGR